MRKLGRMVRGVLTAVSLLLFVVVLVAWVRGYWASEEGYLSHIEMDARVCSLKEWTVSSQGGAAVVCVTKYIFDAEQARRAGWPEGSNWEIRRSGTFLTLDDLTAPGVLWDHGGIRMTSTTVSGWIFRDRNVPSSCNQIDCSFPCWKAAIVFGALPSWRCFVWRRGVRRRRLASREGRCAVCGYDLRASPQRCPECGTAVEARETRGGGAV